ncbi:MAG: hypothetical protein QM602_06600 [Microbacterium sp.]
MTMRATRIADDDIGHYLGFFGPVPGLLLALYTVYLGYSALVLGGATSPLSLAALAAVFGALLLVVVPSATPLRAWRTVTILVVIVFVTAAVSWQLPADLDDLGYLTWEYNPCDLLMFCLAIRGRIASAWIGQLAMQVVVAAWSVTATGSPVHGLLTSYTQAFPLIACSVFAFGLHNTARQIVAHRTAERARAEQEARDETADAALENELRAVRRLATPTLELIAAGGTPDPVGVRSLEAALRDRIRSPNLVIDPLVSALERARARGADVLVLDDIDDGPLTEGQWTTAATWAAERVDAARGDRMTLRTARSGGQVLVTLTVDGSAPVWIEV